MKTYTGIEIGGTKQQIGLFDENGKAIDIVSEKIELKNGAADILSWLKENLPRFSGASAVGAGFGGLVDSASGRTLMSVQVPGWENFSLRDWISENTACPPSS